MKILSKICLYAIIPCVAAAIIFFFQANATLLSFAVLLSCMCLAIGIRSVKALQNYQYTAWIIVAVCAGMLFPQAFKQWGSVDLRNKWLILGIIQLVMFGMGTHIRLKDFAGLASTGKGVLIGLFCHFTVMPMMGWILTQIFTFDAEIAAGIILIGSCSSGLASNVMVYLARANLVLSVVVTAMATLAAPFLTPLLMKLLAGTLIHIEFMNMMFEIIKIVLIPIGAALLADFLKTASTAQRQKILLSAIVALVIIGLLLGYCLPWAKTYNNKPLLDCLEIACFLLGAWVFGTFYFFLQKNIPTLEKIMPLLSMFGIIYFTTVTTAAGRDNLLKVGLLLFVVSVIHNAAGYFFGYWLARLFGLDKPSARTIAFEVGLQNGGMASGLAGTMGKLGTVGLPAAVFSPWMNISGSILANYWRKKSE